MLITKKNKAFDEDFPAAIKKKQRCKKPRDKFSMMHTIPVQVLNLREDSYGGKRGKRMGFTVYVDLTCKQCKPHKFFHKRVGKDLHNSLVHHGREVLPPQVKYSSAPARTTSRGKSAAPSRSKSSKPTAAAPNEIEIVTLELDEEFDDILVVDNDTDVVQEDENNAVDPVTELNGSDDEIECVEEIVHENQIKSYKPKSYKWMQTSSLYQPQVFLMNCLNLKMREESSMPKNKEVGLVELLETLNDDEGNDVLVLEESFQLDGSPVKRNSHIRNLFEEDAQVQPTKRKKDDRNSCSPSKKGRTNANEELLLVEDQEILDIQSMLEISMDETEEIIQVEESEITSFEESLNEDELEILEELPEKDVEVLSVDEVNLEELPEEDVEVLTVDEDDNVMVKTVETVDPSKPQSIKDLVSLWASEEESLISKKPEAEVGKMRTKKRRNELKPYLTRYGS